MEAARRRRRIVCHSDQIKPTGIRFLKYPAAAKLSDDILGVEEASGRITPAGSRPRSQSPHIWGQFRLGPQMTTQPIEPKNRCWATGPCIAPRPLPQAEDTGP